MSLKDRIVHQLFCLFSWGTPIFSWPTSKSSKNQHMAPTNYSHSFMFSAFRLIFLSRFHLRIVYGLRPLWHFCFLYLDWQQLLTTGRVSGPCYTRIPLETQNDEHKSLQIADKMHNRTIALLFQNMFLTPWWALLPWKNYCKISHVFGIL